MLVKVKVEYPDLIGDGGVGPTALGARKEVSMGLKIGAEVFKEVLM